MRHFLGGAAVGLIVGICNARRGEEIGSGLFHALTFGTIAWGLLP